MSGDHNQYQKPEYVDRRQWKYDPMTGRSLSNPGDVTPWEQYAFERGYFRALEVVRETSQREWKELTTAETKALWNATKKAGAFAALLSAKLKEKNNG
jgi:hypothetical protein